jgi:hypothetical protein
MASTCHKFWLQLRFPHWRRSTEPVVHILIGIVAPLRSAGPHVPSSPATRIRGGFLSVRSIFETLERRIAEQCLLIIGRRSAAEEIVRGNDSNHIEATKWRTQVKSGTPTRRSGSIAGRCVVVRRIVITSVPSKRACQWDNLYLQLHFFPLNYVGLL